MPYRPPAPGRRRVLIEMPAEMVAYVDARARARTSTAARVSRASYLRDLIEQDMERAAAAKG